MFFLRQTLVVLVLLCAGCGTTQQTHRWDVTTNEVDVLAKLVEELNQAKEDLAEKDEPETVSSLVENTDLNNIHILNINHIFNDIIGFTKQADPSSMADLLRYTYLQSLNMINLKTAKHLPRINRAEISLVLQVINLYVQDVKKTGLKNVIHKDLQKYADRTYVAIFEKDLQYRDIINE